MGIYKAFCQDMRDGHRTPDTGHRTDNFAPLLNFAQLPKLHVLHHKGLAQNKKTWSTHRVLQDTMVTIKRIIDTAILGTQLT